MRLRRSIFASIVRGEIGQRDKRIGPLSRARRGTVAVVCAATLAALSLPVGASARASTAAHGACVHQGGPGVIGSDALIERGWTVGETDKLDSIMSGFSREICPKPSFLDIDGGSVHQKHIDGDTVWQYTFRVVSDKNRHYTVTAQLPDLRHMRITIRAVKGTLLYRSGTVRNP
jgi:hypothetical protein